METTKERQARLTESTIRKEGCNAERAARAKGLINAINYWDEDEELETIRVDILTDFQHLCDAEGLNYAVLELRAHRHHEEEARRPTT